MQGKENNLIYLLICIRIVKKHVFVYLRYILLQYASFLYKTIFTEPTTVLSFLLRRLSFSGLASGLR